MAMTINDFIGQMPWRPDLPRAVGGFMPNPMQQVPQPIVPPGTPMPMPGSAPVLHPTRGGTYAPGGKNLYNTPFVRDYLAPLLPEAEYGLRLNRIGLGDVDTRRGQFAQGQYGNTQRLYQQAQLQNPALSFRDFLRNDGAGGLENRWRGLAASQRGLNAPSRSSVIRWG
jgi:hypothetical protein